jgi:uncharacterized protein (TIGR02118 family)
LLAERPDIDLGVTMFKLTFCLRRKPSMSLDEFQRYWREDHAPLVAERAKVLGITRYVQVHTLDLADVHAGLQARNGGSPEPFDGVAELWFESLEAMASEDGEVQQALADLLEDEGKFIDLPNSPMWLAQEHAVVG